MSEYQIHQWNQIIDSTNILRPIFTFVPDPDFLKYILNNQGSIILLEISGTGIYDGKQYATCNSSYDFPNFGPTYFETTRQYVMVLHSSFVTYPFENGSFTISTSIRHPANVNEINTPYTLQEPFEQEDDIILSQPDHSFIYFMILTLCLLILILLLFVYIR
jgi:hypothetical protein